MPATRTAGAVVPVDGEPAVLSIFAAPMWIKRRSFGVSHDSGGRLVEPQSCLGGSRCLWQEMVIVPLRRGLRSRGMAGATRPHANC
jgi:hypothetical protein